MKTFFLRFGNANRFLPGFFLFFLLLTGSIQAQNVSTEISSNELLIGTWALNYEKTISAIDGSARSYYQGMDADTKAKLATSFKARRIMFFASGEYILQVGYGNQKRGHWRWLGEGRAIEIVLNGKQKFVHTIGSISENEMVLRLGNSGVKQLFDKWHLQRVSN